MNDQIDAAIAAAAAMDAASALPVPAPYATHTIDVTLASTGRVFAVTFPTDMTDGEVAEAMGWMGTYLLNGLRNDRRAASQLVAAAAMPANLPPAPTARRRSGR